MTPRRSALLFVLDATGGSGVVYRVAVYLQHLVRQLRTTAGLTRRARIEVLIADHTSAQIVTIDDLLTMAASVAFDAAPFGLHPNTITAMVQTMPYEGGGFHVFFLLTRDLAANWEAELPALHQMVASVTGLCCGPLAPPATATRLSKEPGGTRVVNPLDRIRIQFDSIAAWLSRDFGDPPVAPPLPDVVPVPTGWSGGAELPGAAPTPPAPMHPRPATHPTAQWRILEPTDRTDSVPHSEHTHQPGSAGWSMIAASRRGKLHAHEGTYRDDAYALGSADGWNFIAVADGAGSCRLSRVGAHIATTAAIAALQAAATAMAVQVALASDAPGFPIPRHHAQGLEVIQQHLAHSLHAAQRAVEAEARRRAIPVRDLSSTLLVLAHYPTAHGDQVLAGGQIGAGQILLVENDHQFRPLGEANVGFYSGETIFVPMPSSSELERCVWATWLPTPWLVLVMTDGIADDLYPPARQVPVLIQGITGVLRAHPADQHLLDLIAYEKRDSADDRTLAVLYRPEVM